MQATSKSFTSERFQATRPLDYIYDPLFTFSGPKSYYKTANESYQAASEFSVQPIFESMFSDMVRYPRATLMLRPSHHVPHSIDTSYKGKLKAVSQERTITAEVTGPDRYKYFRRPVTETQTSSSTAARFPLLGLDNVTNLGIMAPPTTAEKLRERSARLSGATQVRGVQTDYRETETQTLPWTPPYTTHGKTTPEVLFLDQLTWGDGLPPGQHEVEIIERLRRKKAWETHLPPLDTEANIKKRYKLIAEMEKSDWQFREKEVEAIHEERMKKSEVLLDQHALLNRERLGYRMAFLEHDINKRKKTKLDLIRHDKERALRKLCMKEKGYNPRLRKRNIVDEHLSKTSEIYAPAKRFGTSFKNRHEVLHDSHITVNISDYCESDVEHEPKFDYNKASRPKKQTELCVRETRWTMENLIKLHEDLQTVHAKVQSKTDLFYTQAIEEISKPTRKPEIPSVPHIQETTERLYQVAIMIQKVIHGRAMQTQIHQGRDRWKEVMEELKVTKRMTEANLSALTTYKGNINLGKRLAGVLENIVGLNVGTSIGQTLHLLATELLRLKNEGLAHSQALQSECARWNREVPESGRRQTEKIRRKEHDLMFAQLMRAYQESINEFLTSLIIQSREHIAKREALEHAKDVARLAELARQMVEEPEEEEPVSADLLFEFIAPEGLRELARTCMLILKQKYVEAREALVHTGRAEPLPTAESKETSQPQSDLESSTSSYSDVEETSKGESSLIIQTTTMNQTPLEVITLPPLARFGLVTPISHEDKLLSRIMRDMCYVAGSLLHTAAKILNKALQLSNIPKESFEEALGKTMNIINEAREEIAHLILPKLPKQSEIKPSSSQTARDDAITEATYIVDEILAKAKEKIAVMKKQSMASYSDVQAQGMKLVEDVIKEGQRQVLQIVVTDFLSDLLKEAVTRANIIDQDQ